MKLPWHKDKKILAEAQQDNIESIKRERRMKSDLEVIRAIVKKDGVYDTVVHTLGIR